jgi:hypothetical protein
MVLSLDKNSIGSNCPLCGENNACGNLSSNNNSETCWCMDSAITFPDSLLSQVSDADKNNKCICKACALSHKLMNSTG